MGDNRSEALFKAVGQGDIECVKGLLDDLNQTEIYNLLKIQKVECGSTVVHCAAGKGSPNIIRYLVEYVAENYMCNLLMIQSQEGNTPLHWAAVYGRTETMMCIMDTLPYESVYKLLTVKNVKGYTPLHRVANFGRVKTIQCIVEFIENRDLINALMIQCNTGNTAAHIAVDCGYPNILECIVKSMLPEKAYNLLKLQNDEGHTAIHCAAHRGCIEILKSTLDCTEKYLSSDDLLELLMIKCKLGQHTVVHLMAFTDEIEMMRCLLDSLTPDQRSQILNSENVNELTPWDVANQCEMVDMMTCIERYQKEESDTLAIPRPHKTLHEYAGNEQTVEEPQRKIVARPEARLSEEIKKREEIEQRMEELTTKIADLTSRNTALENSLDEERHKREKAEQLVIEALQLEECKKMQQILANTVYELQSQVNTQNNKFETQLREAEEGKIRQTQESRDVRELKIMVQALQKESEEKRKKEIRVRVLEGQGVQSVPETGNGSPTPRDTVPQLVAE